MRLYSRKRNTFRGGIEHMQSELDAKLSVHAFLGADGRPVEVDIRIYGTDGRLYCLKLNAADVEAVSAVLQKCGAMTEEQREKWAYCFITSDTNLDIMRL